MKASLPIEHTLSCVSLLCNVLMGVFSFKHLKWPRWIILLVYPCWDLTRPPLISHLLGLTLQFKFLHLCHQPPPILPYHMPAGFWLVGRLSAWLWLADLGAGWSHSWAVSGRPSDSSDLLVLVQFNTNYQHRSVGRIRWIKNVNQPQWPVTILFSVLKKYLADFLIWFSKISERESVLQFKCFSSL